jgi:hypothetical protein
MIMLYKKNLIVKVIQIHQTNLTLVPKNKIKFRIKLKFNQTNLMKDNKIINNKNKICKITPINSKFYKLLVFNL